MTTLTHQLRSVRLKSTWVPDISTKSITTTKKSLRDASSFFLLATLLIISPNGYAGLTSTAKTFFEALLIACSLLALIKYSWGKEAKYPLSRSDYLLLIPAGGFIGFWVTTSIPNLSSVIHPIFLFFLLHISAVSLRILSAETLNHIAYMICGALSFVSIFYFALGNSEFSFLWLTVESMNHLVESPVLTIRQYGGFAQKNIFAVLLATGVLLTLHRFQRDSNGQTRLRLIRDAAFCIPMIAATVNLGSLTASLGLLFGLIIALIGSFKARSHTASKLTLFSLMLFLGLSVLAPYAEQVGAHEIVRTEGSTLNKIDATNPSIICRIKMLEVSKDMLFASPLTGSGLDSFSLNYAGRSQSFEACTPSSGFTPSHPHNVLASIAGEMGIIGVVSVLFPVAIWIYTAVKPFIGVVTTAGLLAPIALHSMTEWPLNASLIPWFFIIFIPILVSTEFGGGSVSKPARLNQIHTSGGIVVLFCTALYASSVLLAGYHDGIKKYQMRGMQPNDALLTALDTSLRKHPALAPNYKRIIGEGIMDLAIKTDDPDLAGQFIQSYLDGLGALTTQTDWAYLTTVIKRFPELKRIDERLELIDYYARHSLPGRRLTN